MILYIAEKPSLARALLDVLPKPHKKEDGFIRAGDNQVVSWCIGHLLEQASPDVYDPHLKIWRIEDLPIIPEKWQLLPKENTLKQLNILKKLIAQANEINHVGDPDREGQLLVDEVLHYCGLGKAQLSQVKRCLINDLNSEAIKKALRERKLNSEFIALSTSALARARADWLYGINMSRICTVKGQHSGYRGVLSVGRVQTPLLGLVVRRDKEIESFVPKPFYEVYAHLLTEANEAFVAKWVPSAACEPYQDEDGRVIVKALAENVVKRITQQSGVIENVSKKKREQSPPQPLNLSTLQIEAAKKYGLSAQQVLDICQTLYEKYKLITYPRSDNRFLPEEHFSQRSDVLHAIAKNNPDLVPWIQKTDINIKTKVWSDSKIEAHHAIIPTLRQLSSACLSVNEKHIYALISLYYITQFYPVYQYIELQIDVDILGGKFVAKANQVISLGWKILFSTMNKSEVNSEDELLNLPLKKGDNVFCDKGELVEKETQPPKPFNDATLISAMTGIARFVKDPEIKKVLRQTDGLGTEATRAGIIELLFKRCFLERRGKQIKASVTGRLLIENLPDEVTTPDMTALWESQLDSISKQPSHYQHFMSTLVMHLQRLLLEVNKSSFHTLGKALNQNPKQKKGK